MEEQLQLLLPILKGCTLPPTLALLDGSFKSWLLDAVGIHVRKYCLGDNKSFSVLYFTHCKSRVVDLPTFSSTFNHFFLTPPSNSCLTNKMVPKHLVYCMQGNTLFPSVRCGLEMAVLEALAVSVDCSLWELLVGRRQNTGHCDRSKGSIEVKGIVATTKVCGLIDSTDSPNEVADEAGTLVGQGFCTLKLKVDVTDYDELRFK